MYFNRWLAPKMVYELVAVVEMKSVIARLIYPRNFNVELIIKTTTRIVIFKPFKYLLQNC